VRLVRSKFSAMLCAVRGWSELRSNWIISNIRLNAPSISSYSLI
jgi:hypothetical protein